MTPNKDKRIFQSDEISSIRQPGSFVLSWPKHYGYYDLGGCRFALHKKPSAWSRFWVRVTLGWKWVDADKAKL